MNPFPELHKYDGLGLAELVRTKQISPAELVEYAIARIEAHNPKINAVIHRMYDKARKVAESKLPEGTFMGVPFLLKDATDTVEGEPTSSGTSILRNIPRLRDNEIVQRYRAAGLIFLGKNERAGILSIAIYRTKSLWPNL